jgi:hypothetical protein
MFSSHPINHTTFPILLSRTTILFQRQVQLVLQFDVLFILLPNSILSERTHLHLFSINVIVKCKYNNRPCHRRPSQLHIE